MGECDVILTLVFAAIPKPVSWLIAKALATQEVMVSGQVALSLTLPSGLQARQTVNEALVCPYSLNLVR